MNMMIPDFPHNKGIRLGRLIFFCSVLTLLCLCPVGCFTSEKLNCDSQQGIDKATSECILFFLIWLILFYTYYEEILVSSNLNSNLLRFRCAHPNIDSLWQSTTLSSESSESSLPIKRTFVQCIYSSIECGWS